MLVLVDGFPRDRAAALAPRSSAAQAFLIRTLAAPYRGPRESERCRPLPRSGLITKASSAGALPEEHFLVVLGDEGGGKKVGENHATASRPICRASSGRLPAGTHVCKPFLKQLNSYTSILEFYTTLYWII